MFCSYEMYNNGYNNFQSHNTIAWLLVSHLEICAYCQWFNGIYYSTVSATRFSNRRKSSSPTSRRSLTGNRHFPNKSVRGLKWKKKIIIILTFHRRFSYEQSPAKIYYAKYLPRRRVFGHKTFFWKHEHGHLLELPEWLLRLLREDERRDAVRFMFSLIHFVRPRASLSYYSPSVAPMPCVENESSEIKIIIGYR